MTFDDVNGSFWAIAEILVIVMAPILVTLMAAIHDYAPRRVKAFGLIALGWMLVTAGFTVTVHLVQLTVARRIDLAASPGLATVFDYQRSQWPSLLYAVELIA